MVYLLLSITASTAIYIIFKLFDRFGVKTFPAIVINYWVAVLIGYLLIGDRPIPPIKELDWLPLSIIEGVLFIVIFNVMALTVQKHSVTVGSVASRTAMVIPALILMFILPSAKFSWYTVLGVAIALVGVVLASKKKKGIEIDPRYLWLPIILFVGSGIIDLIIGYVESQLLDEPVEELLFIPSIFLTAAILGTIAFFIQLARGKVGLSVRDVTGGLFLGIVNYASIFFILRAMQAEIVDEAAFFPVNNMGIVVAGTLVGLFGFGDRLSSQNWLGIFLGMVAIAILLFVGQ